MTQETIEKMFTKIKFKLSREYPFFSPISRKVKFVYDEKSKHIVSTDGLVIYFNDNFLKLEYKEKVLYVLHELLHILWLHPQRFSHINDKRFANLYNIIADLRVNDALYNEGHQMPQNTVRKDNIIKYLKKVGFKEKGGHDMENAIAKTMAKDTSYSSEETYNYLKNFLEFENKNDNDKNPTGEGDNNGNSSPIVFPWQDLMKSNQTDQEENEQERTVRDAIAQGVVEEKSRGNKSSNISRMFEKFLVKKEVDWRKLVKATIRSMLRGNRSWKKIHKKTYILPTVIPGYNKLKRIKVVIGIDVSGSIDDKEYKKFVGEINNLAKSYGAEITIVTFDLEIKSEINIKKSKDIDKLRIRKGYGGTSFQEFFEKYGKEKVKVVFTDGWGDQDRIPKSKNTIWLTTDNKKFKFGKVIKIKDQ